MVPRIGLLWVLPTSTRRRKGRAVRKDRVERMVTVLCVWWVRVVVGGVEEGLRGRARVLSDDVGEERGWERRGRSRRMEVKDGRSMVC